MSVQSNLKLTQEIYNFFSNNQFDAVLERATDDVEIYLAPTGQTFQGQEGFKQFMMGFKTTFPNIRIDVKNQVGTEDQVVSEFVATGTNTGPVLTPAGEIPATGRTAEWPVCEVWRFRNGIVASIHNYQDMATMLRQLGLVS